nr:Ni(2+)-binding protein, pNiXb, lipovitellin 2 beta {N-terminal} [Xenopus laevis, oocytes, embryos, Peptide Partial, 20 aa] [Xenopus laevis]
NFRRTARTKGTEHRGSRLSS